MTVVLLAALVMICLVLLGNSWYEQYAEKARVHSLLDFLKKRADLHTRSWHTRGLRYRGLP